MCTSFGVNTLHVVGGARNTVRPLSCVLGVSSDRGRGGCLSRLSWVPLGEQAVGRLLRYASYEPSGDVSWRSSPSCLAEANPYLSSHGSHLLSVGPAFSRHPRVGSPHAGEASGRTEDG
jgi:hypothetical protein